MIGAVQSAFLWARGWAVFLVGSPIVLMASIFVGRDRLFGLVRFWCRALLRAVGIRVEVEGAIPDDDPIVIVAPHVNLFDPVVLGAVLPRHIPGIELDTHFRWPLYGSIIRKLGHLSVSHASPQASRASMRRAESLLSSGGSLVVFPEGHRTRTGARGPFGLWAFRVSARAGVPVVPLAFIGAFDRNRVTSWRLSPGTMRVVVLPPISPAGSDRESAESLRANVAESIDLAATTRF